MQWSTRAPQQARSRRSSVETLVSGEGERLCVAAKADFGADAAATGLAISTKQVRNLVAGRLGKTSSEARLRDLLESFADNTDNACAVIEGDEKQTKAIVMVSAAQRDLFAHYGECMLLDFTHNTNNVGFYLGTCRLTVATTPTGRGVSVADFLCLDQRAVTLTAVFKHLKSVNQTWTRVEVFVIGKNFTEWRVLQKAFSDSMVRVLAHASSRAWTRCPLSDAHA
ncbi:hypothetical protein PybrP1_008327 [[Pythium] brassicae (nom. inval.)]|nr:hypothetical protein PybrP1_008327 [[Pythium] brassicae (nom. inval.)]